MTQDWLSAQVVLAAVLAAVYLLFLIWYGGRGRPLTPEEAERWLARIQSQAKDEYQTTPGLLDELRQLTQTDDGREFYMFNLIRFRPKPLYPPGSNYPGGVMAADARYNKAILRALLRNHSLPVFVGKVQGPFIDEPGDTQWQRVAFVRYRSRRDMLKMVLSVAPLNVGVHKWASIEKTQVFPVTGLLNLVFVRGAVAAVLALVGVALGFLF
jgi:hypothetical protein